MQNCGIAAKRHKNRKKRFSGSFLLSGRYFPKGREVFGRNMGAKK
jgi:hypothetical protein